MTSASAAAAASGAATAATQPLPPLLVGPACPRGLGNRLLAWVRTPHFGLLLSPVRALFQASVPPMQMPLLCPMLHASLLHSLPLFSSGFSPPFPPSSLVSAVPGPVFLFQNTNRCNTVQYVLLGFF